MAIASGRRSITVPGLLPTDPFLERYWVRPGGATVIALEGDDRLTVRDPDGAQMAELTVLAPDGSDDAAAIGGTAEAPATVLRSLLGSEARGAVDVIASLAARGLNPTEATALRLFGEWSPPGAAQTFVAERPVVVVIAAPEGASVLEGGVPASDLDVEVRRTRPRTHDELELPPPLAEPRLDFRVDRATALSYEVKAGEYIQIIDVEGKQCSDFLAFHRGKLEDGVERGFDPTITRTLMGNAFPQPGLFSKFYDLDMDVLVEVIRDTVGRHDSFLLACTSRYYENLGYFGHTNCTDNFNRQLETYAIAPRKGWQALNFFYNTMFATDNLLVFDEPWSRPGDYVLLRAATDLVCASSACPDDVDPANGWDPTEVHVRVYSPEHTFSAAIAHRVTPDAEPRLTTETGFHPRIVGADRQAHRVQRLLAPDELRQPRRDGRVLGLPGARRDHGPLAAPQVRGARPRRRGAAAGHRHPRRPSPRRRPRRLHGDVQRDRRHDRRRDDLPDRRDELPLRRRRRVRRRLAPRAGRPPRPQRVREGVHRPPPQRRGPGSREPRAPGVDRVDAAGADAVRLAGVVPVLRGTHRRCDGRAGGDLADRLHRRARVRDLLPSARCRRGLGRGLGGRREARSRSPRTRRPGHAPDRGRPDLRRRRVRRPGRPVRGRDRRSP